MEKIIGAISMCKKCDTVEVNKELCERFPWLLPYDSLEDAIANDYDYSYTLLDNMETGWKEAFGIQMCEEIQSVLDTLPKSDAEQFKIVQIKEKWGFLHIYAFFPDNEQAEDICSIVEKYSKISKHTCGECGNPAEWRLVPYVYPLCNKCKEEHELVYGTVTEKFSKIEE